MIPKAKLWIETTRGGHDHGGEGWELGTCLWAPGPGRYGSKRYDILKEVRVGEPVIHCYDKYYCGVSWVSETCVLLANGPPNAGPWANRGDYYRVNLHKYIELGERVSQAEFLEAFSAEILDDLRTNKPGRYPFCLHTGSVKPVQGQFLTRSTPKLESLFRRALRLEEVDLWRFLRAEASGDG